MSRAPLLFVGLRREDAAAVRAALPPGPAPEIVEWRAVPGDDMIGRVGRPSLVFVGLEQLDAFGLALDRHKHLRESFFVRVLPPSPEPGDDAPVPRVHLTLRSPLDPAVLAVVWSAGRRMLEFRARMDAMRTDLISAREALAAADDYVQRTLDRALEHASSGAAERSRECVALCRRIAERFEIPADLLPDLDRAARHHALGRALSPDRAHKPARGETETYLHAAAARDILTVWPGLRGAASLIESMCENWDGTGQPGHAQAGQIPLRSRILRIVTDLEIARAARPGVSIGMLVEELAAHAGTLYDPMVIAHLQQIVSSNQIPESRLVRLAVSDLEEGMVLAEDLFTDAGVKLLARGTTLSASALEVISRRSQIEPMRMVAVRRKMTDGGGDRKTA